MLRYFNLLILAVAIASCATPVSPPTVAPVEADPAVDITAQTQRGLPPQQLAANECGLFLWSKRDTSKFIFFTRAGESEALYLLDDLPVTLQVISEGGEIFGQFFTDIKYKTKDGVDVSLSYEPGELLDDGARIKNGLMELTDPAGWQTVVPVLGVRVCQPAVRRPITPPSQLN